MAIKSVDNNVFRYIHFKPARLTQSIEDRVEIDRRNSPNRTTLLSSNSSQIDKENLLKAALKDVKSLKLSTDLVLLEYKRYGGLAKIFSINTIGLSKLSNKTVDTLKSIGIDPSVDAYFEIIERVNFVIFQLKNRKQTFNLKLLKQNDSTKGRIVSVGVARLLVLKQQIKRYEAGEVAHIENVLSGEKKFRNHRHQIKTEELFRSTVDKLTDNSEELETTERFELNKQSSFTFQKDTELGLELTVSGKYGPNISFESNFNAGQTTSSAEAENQSTNYAKDIIARSKKRIVEKVGVEREYSISRDITETNRHILENDLENHKFAVYQYVDKIYESQVFDYGKRQMFDLMVPEPSSYLWHLKENTTLELELEHPTKLEDLDVYDARDVNKNNYIRLGAVFGVSDLPAPPELFISKHIRLAHGTGSSSDTGKHKSGVNTEVAIPSGYKPILAYITILATSDDDPYFSFHVGPIVNHIHKDKFDATGVQGGHNKYSLTETEVIMLYPFDSQVSFGSDEKLFIDIYGYESANYSIHIDLRFYANVNPSTLDHKVIIDWKNEVYKLLLDAYQNLLVVYQQQFAEHRLEIESKRRTVDSFGSPPIIIHKLIHTELKKHCISIIRNEHPGNLVTPHSGEPPQFDIQQSKEDGEIIRFLEHAFEWDQIQYVFYPYFWARPGNILSGWRNRILNQTNDYTMDEF